MTGYTATLVDDEDIERVVEQPQKQPRQWRWLGLSLVPLVVVGAVCCSVWRPRRVTLKQRLAMVSKVSKKMLSGIQKARGLTSEDDPLFDGGLAFTMQEGNEELDGFSIAAEVQKSDATENGAKIVLMAKEGEGETLQQLLDTICNSMKGEQRRLSDEENGEESGEEGAEVEPCKVEVDADNADEVSFFVPLEKLEEEAQHEYQEFEGEPAEEVPPLVPEEGSAEAPLSHDLDPKFTATITLGRSVGEMLDAVDDNKCVGVLPAGVKMNLDLEIAKGMALAAEEVMGPMKSVEDLFAFTSAKFDMAFKYSKEQMEKAPDATPAKPLYDHMMALIKAELGDQVSEKPEGLDSIAGLKRIEIDQDAADGTKLALDITFTHLDLDKIITALESELEA